MRNHIVLYEWKLVFVDADLVEWLECLAVNAKVATFLGSMLASSDTVKSEGRQMKLCWIMYCKKQKSKKTSLKKERKIHKFFVWEKHYTS